MPFDYTKEIMMKQQQIANTSQNIEYLCGVKEQLEQNLTQAQSIIEYIQRQMLASSNGLQTQNQQRLEQYAKQYEQNYQCLTKVSENLNSALEQFIVQVDNFINYCENLIFPETSDELEEWKRQQKAAQYGNPDSVTGLPALSNRSFLVIQQPPLIAKNQFDVKVGLLAAIDKFGFENHRPTAKCRIISEETACELRDSPKRINDPELFKRDALNTVKEKTHSVVAEFKRMNDNNVLGFEFKRLKVAVDRESKTEKFYLLFDCTVTVGNFSFHLFILSLPCMVSTHGIQDMELWGIALWDMALSEGINVIPMKGPPEVRWSKLSPKLKSVFNCIMYANTKEHDVNPRYLNDKDLDYLKMRLFNGCLPEENDPMISWTKFYEDNLVHLNRKTDLPFSFWKWFYSIADMLQERTSHETKVKLVWNAWLIEGFISKREAEHQLKTCSKPTFLLRFCDNHLGSICIVVKYGDGNVDCLTPFLHKEMENNNLLDCINRCQELDGVNFLYPDHDKKKLSEIKTNQKRVRSNKNTNSSIFTEYVSRSNGITVLGDKLTTRHSKSAPITLTCPFCSKGFTYHRSSYQPLMADNNCMENSTFATDDSVPILTTDMQNMDVNEELSIISEYIREQADFTPITPMTY